MNAYFPEKPKNTVPFESSKGKESGDSELDRSGRAIISLLHEAAEAARANEERAMIVARNLSDKVQAAEERVTDLEAELAQSENHALRAEEWLLRLHKEIEDKFFPHRETGSPQKNVR